MKAQRRIRDTLNFRLWMTEAQANEAERSRQQNPWIDLNLDFMAQPDVEFAVGGTEPVKRQSRTQ